MMEFGIGDGLTMVDDGFTYVLTMIKTLWETIITTAVPEECATIEKWCRFGLSRWYLCLTGLRLGSSGRGIASLL